MNIETMWTVESGEYSDHRVHAVFSDEKTAKAWCDALNKCNDYYFDSYRIGRLMSVPSGMKPEKVTTFNTSVELWDDGRTERRDYDITEYPIEMWDGMPPVRPAVRYVRAPCHQGQGGRLDVKGASRESVDKVVSEKLAMWRAGVWAGPKHKEINEV